MVHTYAFENRMLAYLLKFIRNITILPSFHFTFLRLFIYVCMYTETGISLVGVCLHI